MTPIRRENVPETSSIERNRAAVITNYGFQSRFPFHKTACSFSLTRTRAKCCNALHLTHASWTKAKPDPPPPVLSSKTIFHFRSHHNHIYTHISMFTMLPQAAMNWKFSARTFLPLRVSRSVVSPFPSPVFNVWFAAPFTYNFLVVQCVCVFVWP